MVYLLWDFLGIHTALTYKQENTIRVAVCHDKCLSKAMKRCGNQKWAQVGYERYETNIARES